MSHTVNNLTLLLSRLFPHYCVVLGSCWCVEMFLTNSSARQINSFCPVHLVVLCTGASMKYGRSGPLFTDGNRTYRSLKSETVQYSCINKKKTHTEVCKENRKRKNREKEK